MRTNKEKYDALYAELDKRCAAFMKEVLPVVPGKYYAIDTNYTTHKEGYFIAERTIESVSYGLTYRHEKPTRKDIEKLREMVENPPKLTTDRVFLHWRGGYASSADPLSKIGITDGWLAWKPEDLTQKLAHLVDTYSPKDGHIACSYCRKQRKPEDIVYDTIISPNWKHQGFRSDPRPYCKDANCAGYDQMAHEG